MSMRDQALTNIEIVMDNVDHRDKVLAVDIAFGALSDEDRHQFVRRLVDGCYVYHSGTGLLLHMMDCQLLPMDEYCECEACGEPFRYDEPCERCAEKLQRGDN